MKTFFDPILSKLSPYETEMKCSLLTSKVSFNIPQGYTKKYLSL